MKRPLPSGLRCLVTAVAVGAACPAIQAQDEFQQAMEQYLIGTPESRQDALEKFAQILADDPSHEDAYRMYAGVGRELFALMLQEGGEDAATALRFYEIARAGRKAKTDDESAIGELVDDVLGGNYVERRDALYALSANHGEYGAAPFISYLSDDNEDRRVNAIFGLISMGGDAVLPLCAALASDNPRTVWNACGCLGAIGDARAVPYLKHVFDTNSDSVEGTNATVRDAADDALMKITGQAAVALASSTDLHVAAARQYFMGNDSVVTPFDTKDAVWHLEGDGLVATKVPPVLHSLELGKQNCNAAIHDARAQAMLLACLAAEKAILTHAEAMGEDPSAGGDLVAELQSEIDVYLGAGGPERLEDALREALAAGRAEAAVMLISSLEASDSSGAALREALGNQDKRVRYAAAFALAGAGEADADVVRVLVSALGEDAVRTVLVVDDVENTRNELVDILRANFAVVHAPSGALGFARARTAPAKDVIIVRAGMADVEVSAFVHDSDFRTSASPMLLIASADRADEVRTNYEGKGNVRDFLTPPYDAAAVTQAVNDALPELNAERADALGAAARAAQILAHLPSSDLGTAEQGLVAALSRSEDDVVGPVLRAVGRLGPSSAAADVAAIFADDSRSAEIRLAAAGALGGIFGKMSANPGDDVLSPVVAVATSRDADSALRVAASQALGKASFLDEVQRAELLRPGGSE